MIGWVGFTGAPAACLMLAIILRRWLSARQFDEEMYGSRQTAKNSQRAFLVCITFDS
jgi:hypothetical protein